MYNKAMVDKVAPDVIHVDAVGIEPPDEHSLVGVFQGGKSIARVNALRQSLDDSLDLWWSHGKLPARGLLRDSLLALEAGHDLDEVHRSLLLRTALQERRGMITALRHQTDPDRTAFLIKEALLNEQAPLPPTRLWKLRREDDQSAEWAPLLVDELTRAEQGSRGTQQQLMQIALRQLGQTEPLTDVQLPGRQTATESRASATDRHKTATAQDSSLAAAMPVLRTTIPLRWTMGRLLLLGLFCVTTLASIAWVSQRPAFGEMVTIPTAAYRLGNDPLGLPERTISVVAFAIDPTEVTNRSYRRCLEQGGCAWPVQFGSTTRADYFLASAYAEHPVGHVDWSRANAYCAWAGRRLPSADEWEIAASVAPATGRAYRYPWGDAFQPELANGQASGVGDTQIVGFYHPTGNSSFGMTDMAGNVAEWTATTAGNNVDETLYAAKGGSYLDDADALQAYASRQLPASTAEAWLGFRCAASLPTEEVDIEDNFISRILSGVFRTNDYE